MQEKNSFDGLTGLAPSGLSCYPVKKRMRPRKSSSRQNKEGSIPEPSPTRSLSVSFLLLFVKEDSCMPPRARCRSRSPSAGLKVPLEKQPLFLPSLKGDSCSPRQAPSPSGSRSRFLNVLLEKEPKVSFSSRTSWSRADQPSQPSRLPEAWLISLPVNRNSASPPQ